MALVALAGYKVTLQGTDGKRWIPLHELKHTAAVGIDGDGEEVRVLSDSVAEVIGEAKEEAVVVELGEGDLAAGEEHEKLADSRDALGLHGVHEGALLFEEGLHMGGEGEVGPEIQGEVEEEGMAGTEAGDLAATREAKLAVELARVGEGETVVEEVSEEGLSAGDEAEVSVIKDDGLEVGEAAVGIGLDGPHAGALELLPQLGVEEGEDIGRGCAGGGSGGGVRGGKREGSLAVATWHHAMSLRFSGIQGSSEGKSLVQALHWRC